MVALAGILRINFLEMVVGETEFSVRFRMSALESHLPVTSKKGMRCSLSRPACSVHSGDNSPGIGSQS
jgi:hypothetical protein